MEAPRPEPTGLDDAEAERRLAEIGPNEPVVAGRSSLLADVGRRFTNPLVAILLLASAASAVLRDYVDAAIVLAIVALSIAVELVQSRRSARAAEALRAHVAQTATVRRAGVYREIPRRAIVPGDVVRLSAGDMIPADCTLAAAKDLHVGEAALTGESMPVERAVGEPVLMGSSVVSGTGVAIVETTGPRTQLGGIAGSLPARHPPTELERGTARFGVFIMKTVVFLVLFVFVVTAVLRRDPLESLLFAVALAVGLTPEFLPMITTVTLTRGAVRMARQHVIVKNLASIQSFGSMDVLCSDKTGTLTTGEMTLERHVDVAGAASERPLLWAYVNAYFESGVDNAMDAALLEKARLDPLDSAVLRHEHPDISGFSKLDEIPFDFERRRVSVVVERAGERRLVTKGAPEQMLEVATRIEVAGELRPLDAAALAQARATYAELGREGYRVLAVAWRDAGTGPAWSTTDERELVLVGFLAFADPPRPDAKRLLAELRKEGVQVKILTGDSDLVLAHVCAEVGLSMRHALLGKDIDKMSDPALAHRAERTHVFARLSPAQKSRVLRALKSRGHVVGFLGDGINDAPSLHAADVGISVSSATDVAKEAADIILLEPGLGVVLTGILEGRRAFGNVMKYLLMGTSSAFGNMFSMAGASLVLPFLPMLPTQILLNNFLYDVAQLTIPSDNVDPAFVKKPRRWNVDLIRRFMLVVGPISSLYDFLTFFVLLRVFHASEAVFHTGWFVESLATQTLVIFVVRTAKSPLASRPSRALLATSVAIVALGLVLPYLPFASRLGFTPLPASFYALLVVGTATYLGLVELVKRTIMKRALA